MTRENTDRRRLSAFRRTGGTARPAAWLRSGLLLLALGAQACATASLVNKGRQAEQVQDYDRAVAQYTQALRQDPDNTAVRTALGRAKLRSSEYHFNRGRRMAAAGRLDEAAVELQVAAEMNPSNGLVDAELQAVRHQLRAKVAVVQDGKTALESLIDRARSTPPPGLELPRGIKLPSSLVFRDANSRDVYTAIARFADINLLFDPAFRDVPLSVDLRNSTFDEALNAVSDTTHNFYRVTGARAVTIIPDTPAKRREYEEEIVRTFYLSNADVKETIDMLRMVVDLRRLAPITATNAVSIRDTPERIEAAGRLIAAIDKARPEVVVDVELLEVNRSKVLEYGLQIASPGQAGIGGAADVNQTGMTLAQLRYLNSSGVFLTGLPALYYRLMKSDLNTRVLANPQLRTSDGTTAQARFGDRVPVPSTTFQPIATGGVAQQPVTSYAYENIGVNIDITPRTHHDEDVSLQLKVELSNISGTGYGGLPTFGNRSVTTAIRLKDGETSVLGGLIRDEERTVLEGFPGLSDLPVIGRLFARNKKERLETDIILTLTPHVVRVLDLSEEDLRAFRIGRDTGGSFEPTPVEVPPRDLPKPIK